MSCDESEAVRVYEPVDLEDAKAAGARRGGIGDRLVARFGPSRPWRRRPGSHWFHNVYGCCASGAGRIPRR
jgi:hypothetical protein